VTPAFVMTSLLLTSVSAITRRLRLDYLLLLLLLQTSSIMSAISSTRSQYKRVLMHTVDAAALRHVRSLLWQSMCIRFRIKKSPSVLSPIIDQLAQRHRRSRRTTPSKQEVRCVALLRSASLEIANEAGSNGA